MMSNEEERKLKFISIQLIVKKKALLKLSFDLNQSRSKSE